MTKLWKFVIFWSRSSGNFWTIFFLLLKSKILPSKELRTPVVGGQEPGYLNFGGHCLHLDGDHVLGDDVATAFAL